MWSLDLPKEALDYSSSMRTRDICDYFLSLWERGGIYSLSEL